MNRVRPDLHPACEEPPPMTGHALPSEDPTPPDGIPTPPTGLPAGAGAPEPSPEAPGGVERAERAAGPVEEPGPSPAAAPRRLRAVPDAYPTVVSGPRTGAFGRPIGKHRPTALQRLVEVARVLTGGLMVLALVVVVAPLVLAGSGPGLAPLVGHLVGAGVALAATGVAAWRRTPVWAATVAALVVPVDVLAVLAIFWWA